MDELPENRRPEVKSKISSWQRSFPDIPIIVTSRPSDEVKEDWLNAQKFDHAAVLPLENDRVTDFVTNWHKALEVWKPPLKTELDELVQKLISMIYKDRTLQDLATTPLVLSALCAIHRNKKGNLPKNRTDLYGQLVTMLLDRDKERKIPNPLDSDATLYYLRKLALELVRAEEVQASTSEVIKFLERNPKPGESTRASVVYKSLIERSGVIREPVTGQVDYIHRTLQEYLAAAEIVATGLNANELVNNAEKDFWSHIIEFSGGISKNNGPFQESLVKGLFEKRKYLQALEAVRGAITDNSAPYVSKCAETAVSRLVLQSEVYPISAAGSLALPYLGYDAGRGGWHLGLRIRVLAAINTPESYKVLQTYKGCKKPGVIDALINIASETFGQRKIIEEFIREVQPEELQSKFS